MTNSIDQTISEDYVSVFQISWNAEQRERIRGNRPYSGTNILYDGIDHTVEELLESITSEQLEWDMKHRLISDSPIPDVITKPTTFELGIYRLPGEVSALFAAAARKKRTATILVK